MTAEQEKAVLKMGLRGNQELRGALFEWTHLLIGWETGLGLETWLNLGFEDLQKKDGDIELMDITAESISCTEYRNQTRILAL